MKISKIVRRGELAERKTLELLNRAKNKPAGVANLPFWSLKAAEAILDGKYRSGNGSAQVRIARLIISHCKSSEK